MSGKDEEDRRGEIGPAVGKTKLTSKILRKLEICDWSSIGR